MFQFFLHKGQNVVTATGTAAASSTASATSKVLISSVGTAAASSTASATSKVLISSVGTAAASSTASATSKVLVSSVGTAAASSSALAVSQFGIQGTGIANGNSSASATAVLIFKTIGVAAGNSTALAFYPVLVNTDLATVLLDVVNRLISCGLFEENTCFLALKPEAALEQLLSKGNLYPPSSQYAIVTPGRQIIDGPIRVGGGRSVMVIDGEFSIMVFNQCALDLPIADATWLTQNTVGVLGLSQCIINCLELFQPTNQFGDPTVPMGFELKRYSTFRRNQALVGWGQAKLDWKIEWTFTFLTP